MLLVEQVILLQQVLLKVMQDHQVIRLEHLIMVLVVVVELVQQDLLEHQQLVEMVEQD
tara:strand:- start:119 stop:292 length:174 start_codon:yes stop_codon:yes gene_type:complete